jgi:hypothetical protein
MNKSKKLLLLILICLITATSAYAEPKGQPDQLVSPVEYDENLSDPFFDLRDIKHTANLVTDQQYEHMIRYCDAELKNGSIELYIHDFTPSTNDNLKIKIVGGFFQSQYWTTYVADRGDEGLTWTTKKQKLILDKKNYKKGDIIKGKLEFECVQQVTNPEYKGTSPHNIKIEGVFKAVVK